MKEYSIGQILREKLMISRTGKPYKNKISIKRIIVSHKIPFTIVNGPHGLSYRIPEYAIRRHNSEMLQVHAIHSGRAIRKNRKKRTI